MYYVNVKESLHEFEKTNLITIMGRKGGYDKKVCKNCGIKGNQYNLDVIQIGEHYKRENAFLCRKAKPIEFTKKIKITFCTAHGKSFSNLTPDSIHEIITPPKGYSNDSLGVWVMGNGEPVKVLNNEFISIKE
jgi:hypothetical protein